jgi:hypothetical protein
MTELLATTPKGSHVYRKNGAMNAISDSGRSRTFRQKNIVNFYKHTNPPGLKLRVYF